MPIVEGRSIVEVHFDNLNFSDVYNFNAYAVSQDLMTPIGKPVSGIIPAIAITSSSYDMISPTTSAAILTVSTNPVTKLSTSTASSTLGLQSIVPIQSILTG